MVVILITVKHYAELQHILCKKVYNRPVTAIFRKVYLQGSPLAGT